MHIHRSIYIIQFVILFSFIRCEAQESIAQHVNLLVQKERHDDNGAFEKFRQYSVQAIPYLIDVIDKNEKGFVGFDDSLSSRFFPFHLNYVGIRAAYMIEFILADTNAVKIFQYGVIVKKANNQSQMAALSLRDMQT